MPNNRTKTRTPRPEPPARAIKILLLCALLLTLPWSHLIAATNVSGVIATDTTWTRANSPYIVTGYITVQGTDGPDGITTLTIEPGVEVRLNPYVSINIGGHSGNPGALAARGTAAEPIVFTAHHDTPSPGYWGYIGIHSTSVGQTTVLEHCFIQFAGSGNQGAVRINHAEPIIRHSTISNNSGHGIYIASGSIPTIDNCKLKDNGNYDLYFVGTAAGKVSNTTIHNGLYLNGTGTVLFDGNTINQNNAYPVKTAADNVDRIVNGCTFNNVDSDSFLEVTSGNITRDATWTGAIAYFLRHNLTIQGTDGDDGVTTLSIAAGARLRFNRGTFLQVGAKTGAPGALRAEGTAEEPIILTSNASNPAPGDWFGVRILNTANDDQTMLQHCIVEHAGLQGHGPSATVYIDNAAPALLNCTLRHGKSQDLLYTGTVGGIVKNCTIHNGVNFQTAGSVQFSDNIFNYDNNFPIRTSPDNVGHFVNGNTFADLDDDSYLEISGASLTRDSTWTGAIAYVLRHGLTIQGTDGDDGVTTLTLTPGAQLKFNSALALQVGAKTGAPGALKAEGTVAAPVLFTSNAPDPAPGSWVGIRILGTSEDDRTILQHCIVEYAGLTGYGAAATLLIENAGPTLRHCEFRHNKSYDLFYSGMAGGSVENSIINKGVNLQSNGAVFFSGNTIHYDNDYPIRVYADNVHSLVNSNSFRNLDTASFLEISSGDVTKDATWTAVLPIHIRGNPRIQGSDGPDQVTTLTIAAGAQLLFANSASLHVGAASGAPGRLIAHGAPDQMILFSSSGTKPMMGSWRGIQLHATADPQSSLDYCVLEYAGSPGANTNCGICVDAKASIRNSMIRHNTFGIRAVTPTASGTEIVCNTFFSNNYGIYAANATLAIEKNNFLGNTNHGLYNAAHMPVSARDNWWGDINGPNQGADKTHGNVDFTPWADTIIQCSDEVENKAPYLPAAPQPANNAIRVHKDIWLTWAGGDPDPLDKVRYDIHRGTSPETVGPFALDLSDRTYRMTDLTPGISYYWQIVARDNHGLQTTGPLWRFTTVGGQPDLIVSGLFTSPGGNLHSGQNVTLTAQLQNIGAGPVVDPFHVSFKAASSTIGSPIVNAVMLAGETIQVSQPWTCIDADPTMEIMADANHRINESNEQNNLFIAALSQVADNTPPALISTNPAHNEHIKALQDVKVTLSDSQSAIDTAAVLDRFTLSNIDGTSITGSKTASNDTFVFTPEGLLPDGEYEVFLAAVDTFGNSKDYRIKFFIDSTPPGKPIITGGTITSGTIEPRPAQNATDQFVIELTGTRDPGTSVWLNGSMGANLAGTPWSVPVTLDLGSNTLEVWLVDHAGNEGPSEWVDIQVITANAIEYEYNAAGRLRRILPAVQP